MNRMFLTFLISITGFAAHAERFVISHPTLTMGDSGTVMSLNISEGRPSFALSTDPLTQLNIACGIPNANGTSLLAVSVNGEIKIVGRKRDCVNALAKIAASHPRFGLTIDLVADEVERAAPGFEYQINASVQ